MIIFYPIPIWGLRLCSLQKTCIGNASKPCISVHFVETLFIFASSHWESIKQNQYCYQSGFIPFHRLLLSTFTTPVTCFTMPPLIPLINTTRSCPLVSNAYFPKILIDGILHTIFVENITVQCHLPQLNYYLSFSVFNLSPSAPAGSLPKPDVDPYTQFKPDFYVHGCLCTFSCT